MFGMDKKSAYWTEHTHFFSDDEFECSNCKKMGKKAYPKCPNCNARMKKSKYEPTWVDELEIFDIFSED